MKLQTIKQKFAKKKAAQGTYHIPDGEHEGTIVKADYNADNDRVYLKIQLENGDIFNSSAELADYGTEPLCRLIEPFVGDDGEVEFSEMTGYTVVFETKTRKSKDGKQFSNIVDLEYVTDEDEEELTDK